MQNIVINKPWYIDPNEVSICEFFNKSKYTFSKKLKEVGNNYDVVAAGLNGSNIVWRILIDKKGEAQAD